MKYYEFFILINGLAYVLAIRAQKRIGWIFGISSCIAQAYVSYKANYFLDCGLNVVYIVMGVWGFIHWNRPQAHFSSSSLTKFDKWLYYSLGCLTSLALGFFFKSLGNANPYLDAFTTVFSLLATWLVVRKVIDNWLIWVIVDTILAYMFYDKGLHINASLYLVYGAIAIWGWTTWKRK